MKAHEITFPYSTLAGEEVVLTVDYYPATPVVMYGRDGCGDPGSDSEVEVKSAYLDIDVNQKPAERTVFDLDKLTDADFDRIREAANVEASESWDDGPEYDADEAAERAREHRDAIYYD